MYGIVAPFPGSSSFLAWAGLGTPLAEVPGLAALRAGHRVVTFIHHMEVLVQSLWWQETAE